MSIGNAYRLDIIWHEVGGLFLGENVLHYLQTTDTINTNGAEDLAYAAQEIIVPAMALAVSSSYECREVRVRGITVQTEGFDWSFTALVGGRTLGDTYAKSNGALVSWKTGLIGRDRQGRTYFPASTEGDWDSSGVISPGYRAVVEATADTMITIPQGASHAGYALCISSYFVDGAPRPSPVHTVVTSRIVRDYTGVQRGRRF